MSGNTFWKSFPRIVPEHLFSLFGVKTEYQKQAMEKKGMKNNIYVRDQLNSESFAD